MKNHDNGSPGSHPHADRPNWQRAESFDDYILNCREGLEAFSERRAAKLLGVSRMLLYRAKLMAQIPEELFEHLLANSRGQNKPPSTTELANIGRAISGEGPPADVECCPHCGEVIRVRPRVRASVAKVVNDWLGYAPAGRGKSGGAAPD